MRRWALLAVLLAGSAYAQDSGQAARNAASALEAASLRLEEASTARNRVRALTDTVRAYEDGLAAMRVGLRAASIRETELTRKLSAQEDEISQLLGVLSALGGAAGPETLVHPGGPVGTARSGMLLASVTPGLAQKAAVLRRDLEEVTELRQLQQSAANTLQQGLMGAQTARTGLSQAVADRTDLPQRFTEDSLQVTVLIAATETLAAFASGLGNLPVDDLTPALPAIDALRGALPLPVRGEILRRAGEADAAGVTRPGIVLATEAEALVTTPTAATIRYNGPLLDYGLVSILEPQSDLLIVLAGLDTVFGTAGQVLPEGAPVGLMGGAMPQNAAELSPSGEGGGNPRPETLYIEVRQGETPVDPLTWFASE